MCVCVCVCVRVSACVLSTPSLIIKLIHQPSLAVPSCHTKRYPDVLY